MHGHEVNEQSVAIKCLSEIKRFRFLGERGLNFHLCTNKMLKQNNFTNLSPRAGLNPTNFPSVGATVLVSISEMPSYLFPRDAI